jgi:histidinol-phosphate aminotransferase
MAFYNDSDHPVRFPEISYGFYQVYADLYGIDARRIPLNEDFSISIEDYLGNEAGVVIANPNAPTGLALSRKEVERIVKANPDHVVLIDEAYVDFGAESCVELVDRYNNLLVVGTYSKSRSMAGARLGFAFGHPDLIADLEKIKYSTNPYNINRLTLLAGEAAITDQAYYTAHCKEIMEIRDEVQTELRNLGFFCTDSKTNFIFAKSDQIDGNELYLELKKRGILVRHFHTPSICQYNRITVGTREQMQCLLREIQSIIKR